MTKSFIAAYLVVLFITAANGQTAADLAKKYAHHEVYEVQPGVQMTLRFASDRQVCEMQVEQAHFGENGADLRDGLDQFKINAIIDQLVPVGERGKKINTLYECVGVCQTVDEYSKVFVHVFSVGSTRLVSIKWRNRNCE
jgi:hypothetical protein